MADTEITRIESLIQSAEAFGGELHKADECAESIIGIREESRETAGSLRDALYRLESETTPRVLEMSRRVFSGYGNDKFGLDIMFYVPGSSIYLLPCLDTYKSAEVSGENGIIAIKATHCKEGNRMCLTMHPNAISVRRKFIGLIPLKDKDPKDKYPHIQMNYIHPVFSHDVRLSRNGDVSPQEIFRIIADKYGAESDTDYLDRYVEMYARLPQLIVKIGEGLKGKENARKAGLEASIQKVERLAGE